MTVPEISLTWSRSLSLSQKARVTLRGDKILLPKSALEQLLEASSLATRPAGGNPYNRYITTQNSASRWRETYQQLPQPLTFLLVNIRNGKKVHAGIQEFSADEGEICLSPYLSEALNVSRSYGDAKCELSNTRNEQSKSDSVVNNKTTQIEVHAICLPKGSFLKLRPLEAGYNPADWKSLLERHLRENFTTLTRGETLTVQTLRSGEFKFLIDELSPAEDGICIIDTDLEVDIEALNEEQARETLKQIMATSQPSGIKEGISIGGSLEIQKIYTGTIMNDQYVDYTLLSWDRSRGVVIEASGQDIELLISPFSPHQRVRPREDEHIWADFSTQSNKRITIESHSVDIEKAEALYITLHARVQSANSQEFSIQVRPTTLTQSIGETADLEIGEEVHSEDDKQCRNCHKWLSKSKILLHENFCHRNNTLCSLCHNVFLKNSPEWRNHWHCEHDSAFGQTSDGKKAHLEIFHTLRPCPNCSHTSKNLIDLAAHRTTVCPGKIILCQFCHLEVPQEGDPNNPSPEAQIYGLTFHELVDGGRTTECHLCSKMIRLRDVPTHMKHHDFEKNSRSIPRICNNIYCCRTLDMVWKFGKIQKRGQLARIPQNDLGLCDFCFSPFYVNIHDPDGKALKRRIERRYLSQMISGCGKSWCRNQYCKTAQNLELTSRTALPKVKLLVQPENYERMYFCVDEVINDYRLLAELIATENIYALEWCIAAVEDQGSLDNAKAWLNDWAPKLEKSTRCPQTKISG